MTHDVPPTNDGCSCPDFRVSRRRFLGGLTATAGALAVTSVFGDAYRQVSYGASGTNGNVLVVLSLRGGADGLSMVVPYGDTGYAAARPRIAVPSGKLIETNGMFGLHPKFKPLQAMWRAGTFGAVHAIGLPQPNRSHFTAMEAIEDADPGSTARLGWINRMVGLTAGANPAEAVQLGSAIVPTSLFGSAPVMGLEHLTDLKLGGGTTEQVRHRESLTKAWANTRGAIGTGARSALRTTDQIGRLATIIPKPHNGAVYPEGSLGDVLLDTATLIRAKVGARVVTIDYGSWDMHVDVGTLDWGWMAKRVDELARALAAFFKDLGLLGQQVTLVTLSEFGRRVAENGNWGLDHGYGNCMLLLGAGVRGSQVHGQWPGLARADLIDGDLAVTRDYRSVLAAVLRARFPDIDVSKVFPNFQPESINVMT
jgi:uncharacterized protein (DUF1501 family)